MAYMNQEKKAEIRAALNAVVPKGWKFSLSVHHHSSITMTIKSAPVDLIAAGGYESDRARGHVQINHYHLGLAFQGEILETMKKIVAALNTGNHDNSDAMTDYFDVGHYVHLNLGKWDKPFVVKK